MARRGNRRTRGIGPLSGIIALVVLAVGSVALFASDTRSSRVAGIASDISGSVGTIVSSPARWGHNALAYLGSFFGGATLNAKLKAENDQLRVWREQARSMSERLVAYEKLLNITSERIPSGVAGRMIGDTNSSFSRAGLVNVGSEQGVAVNWVVINQNGLVGRVIAVGARSSRVLLLGDGDSRVPVMGEVTRARALLAGDKTSAPRLYHLNTPTLMRDGEIVLTSGDDGLFPRGITVGQANIAPDKQWRVRLGVESDPVDFVRLVPPSNIVAPPEDVTAPSLNAPPVGASDSILASSPAGAILPLAPGAAPVPTAATPEAIRAAQTDLARRNAQQAEEARTLTKKLIAERDAAREAVRKAEAARREAEQKASRANRPTQAASNRAQSNAEPETDAGRPQRSLRPVKKLDPNAVPVAPSALKQTGQSATPTPPAQEGPQ
jgi:rod shape-determining protein MreC